VVITVDKNSPEVLEIFFDEVKDPVSILVIRSELIKKVHRHINDHMTERIRELHGVIVSRQISGVLEVFIGEGISFIGHRPHTVVLVLGFEDILWEVPDTGVRGVIFVVYLITEILLIADPLEILAVIPDGPIPLDTEAIEVHALGIGLIGIAACTGYQRLVVLHMKEGPLKLLLGNPTNSIVDCLLDNLIVARGGCKVTGCKLDFIDPSVTVVDQLKVSSSHLNPLIPQNFSVFTYRIPPTIHV